MEDARSYSVIAQLKSRTPDSSPESSKWTQYANSNIVAIYRSNLCSYCMISTQSQYFNLRMFDFYLSSYTTVISIPNKVYEFVISVTIVHAQLALKFFCIFRHQQRLFAVMVCVAQMYTITFFFYFLTCAWMMGFNGLTFSLGITDFNYTSFFSIGVGTAQSVLILTHLPSIHKLINNSSTSTSSFCNVAFSQRQCLSLLFLFTSKKKTEKHKKEKNTTKRKRYSKKYNVEGSRLLQPHNRKEKKKKRASWQGDPKFCSRAHQNVESVWQVGTYAGGFHALGPRRNRRA